jgi:branched-chain amino acid transport system permease protein
LALAFVISGVATVVAGILLAPAITVTPSASYVYLGIAFCAVVIGTKGNVLGAMVGGILVGLTEAVTIALIGDEWKDAFVFALVLIFLLVRPEGLFGKRANA